MALPRHSTRPRYWHAEEDDVLLATSHWTGYYVITTFPFTKQWEKMGAISTYPKREQKHILNLYKVRAVLYRCAVLLYPAMPCRVDA